MSQFTAINNREHIEECKKLLCVHVQVTQGQVQQIETNIFKQKMESWWTTLVLPEQCKNMKVPPSSSHQSKKQTAVSSQLVAER